MRTFLNSSAMRGTYSAAEQKVTSVAAAKAALAEIVQWPDYAPSPIRALPGSAAELNLGRVFMKDESGRLNQGSFKSLGGAYAATLKVRGLADPHEVTLCCATEGNHGRSIAFAARRLGCKAVIFMHQDALQYKVEAIEALGAQVVRTPGNYDDAVVIAAQTAAENGWLVVSDTNDATDESVHHVMQGYGVMALEAIEQFADTGFPTHVFLQAGVGGLAAGVAGVLSDHFGEQRPRFIIVEPDTAACVYQSAVQQAPASLSGSVATVMQMLAVGKASPAAWPVLQRRGDAFITVSDDEAVAVCRRLNAGDLAGEQKLNIGLSGVAGLTGLHALLQHRPALVRDLELDSDARVLVIGTEAGPSAHTAIVGGAAASADETSSLPSAA